MAGAEGSPPPRNPGEPRRWPQLPRIDGRRRREPLTITVTYRGGPECWYEVRARGVVARRPGHVSFHDLMREIYGDLGPDQTVPWSIVPDLEGSLAATRRRRRSSK